MVSLILILLSAPIYVDAAISCKNLKGEDVDWFVALKRPTATDDSDGTSFVYFDSTRNNWVESEEKITSKTSAIGATVSQLYGREKVSTVFALMDFFGQKESRRVIDS
ncbi:hypothetical protein ANCCAN_22789 [Ancylostoma caninum]|uniref:Uncharacterized protein n=1 Tax=Ancylostoma caninum TaxID=29170 RepID=A0A368FH24_ANCCA|nr:hypothetical protein ANCCAN_22789 [Ancylostoma caninum]